MESYKEMSVFIPVDIMEDVVESAAHKILGSAGPGGMELEALQGWLLKFGDHRKELCISFESLVEWMSNKIPL